jgi:hypothetical protein
MKQKLLIVLLCSCLNIQAQCEWSSFFPFKGGNSKFDIAQIRSTNSTLADPEDKYGTDDSYAKYYNGYRKYEYLKDSVYINIVNLRFVNNTCFTGSNNQIQLTLSDDKLHKATVELNYDDYNTMKKQYEELKELVPEIYGFTKPFEITNSNTKEKIGEGIGFYQKSISEKSDKINHIDISYGFNFKKVWDNKTKKYSQTSEIENYTIKIELDDLRQSKLTGQGY